VQCLDPMLLLTGRTAAVPVLRLRRQLYRYLPCQTASASVHRYMYCTGIWRWGRCLARTGVIGTVSAAVLISDQCIGTSCEPQIYFKLVNGGRGIFVCQWEEEAFVFVDGGKRH